MMKYYQVTIYHKDNRYKPISTIVQIDQGDDNSNWLLNDAHAAAIKTKGIQKICMKKYWGASDLKRYEYTRVRAREYNKE